MKAHLSRRQLLVGSLAFAIFAPRPAFAQPATGSHGVIDAADFGVVAGAGDQSQPLQQAIDAAASAGMPLFLAGGAYAASGISLPSAITLFGVRGATRLVASRPGPVFRGSGATAVTLRDLGFDGAAAGGSIGDGALIVLDGCDNLELDGLELSNGAASGLQLTGVSGRVENCIFSTFGDNAIFALDSTGLSLTGNRITNCGNGGIRVWGSATGHRDRTIVASNDISAIRFDGGGNGQNGNGINVYNADGVTITGNRMRDCAFSAIRLNATNNSIISANTCLASGEVAIFSEFAFSGSVITDNIVDGAAQGISMTNLDAGGRLATCTGNLIRNIAPRSLVNPDTTPVGIFAEADAVIANNAIDSVPGLGIGAGWGPYLRNVSVTGNVIRDVEVGIGVSVAEGAGRATIAGNHITEARRAALAALAWRDIVTDDLQRDASRFPNITVGGNSVG